MTRGCEVVRDLGKALVEAMEMARKAGDPMVRSGDKQVVIW